MPIDERHPVMTTPKGNITLWRYIDIPTFLSLLIDQSLTFVRANLFEDKFEGKLPKRTAEAIDMDPKWNKGNPVNKALRPFSETLNDGNHEVYLNCWCNENHEMVHMWKIYSKENGIAIETDYETLKKMFNSPETAYPTEIKYIDFKNDFVNWNSNALTVYTLKRIEYKSEREFRLILPFPKILQDQVKDIKDHNERSKKMNQLYLSTPVIKCNVNPVSLIKKIHVSPYAPKWYLHLISGIADKYGLTSISITQSDL